MNPYTTNSIGQPGCSGDYSNLVARLPIERESAGSYAGHPVSVHKIQEQNVQLSSQKPIGVVEISNLGNFKISKHGMNSKITGLNKVQSFSSLAMGGLLSYVNKFFQYFWCDENEALIAENEKSYHPSVSLKFEGGFYQEIVGCLNFKRLLNCSIDIIPTRKGDGVCCNPIVFENGSTKDMVEVERGKEETIITFISDIGFKPVKLHISNDYWIYNDFNQLIARYESMNLIRTAS